jgi:hypothetical protein
MITMIDEMFDRHYQHGRKALNDSLVSALASFGNVVAETFRALHRIEYEAPWARPARRARSN